MAKLFTEEEILKFSSENEFMFATVELLKYTIQQLHKIIHSKYIDEIGKPINLNRDSAILAGNLIRLAKINTSFLQNVCENKLEICYILSRSIYETQINILYFLTNGEENVYNNYVKYSLLSEKKLYEIIKKNIEERNGIELNIEKRMKLSIEKSFNISEIEIEELNKSSNWKSLKKRLEKIDLKSQINEIYNVFYGLSSHFIHGNWQDLVENHLNYINDKNITINYDWNKPKPHLLSGVIIFNLLCVKMFAKTNATDQLKEELLNKFRKLFKYKFFLSEKYEQFISDN